MAESLNDFRKEWEYWINRSLVYVLDFVKSESDILISCTGTKKSFVNLFQVFRQAYLIIKIFFTHLTRHCLICLFHMDNHLD